MPRDEERRAAMTIERGAITSVMPPAIRRDCLDESAVVATFFFFFCDEASSQMPYLSFRSARTFAKLFAIAIVDHAFLLAIFIFRAFRHAIFHHTLIISPFIIIALMPFSGRHPSAG